MAEKPDSQEALESRLTGDFRGWGRGATFMLENGQRWRVDDNVEYVSPTLSAPAVRILPGRLGSFWMEIEGVKTKVKVKPVNL